MRLTMTRAVSGFSARGQPLGQREPAAGGAAVGRGISVGGLPYVATVDEARLRLAALGVDVAANQEVRRRRVVAARTRVQVAAFELCPERRDVASPRPSPR